MVQFDIWHITLYHLLLKLFPVKYSPDFWLALYTPYTAIPSCYLLYWHTRRDRNFTQQSRAASEWQIVFPSVTVTVIGIYFIYLLFIYLKAKGPKGHLHCSEVHSCTYIKIQ